MGGGGVIRAATKVAGMSVVNGGLRGAGLPGMSGSTEQSMIRSVTGPASAGMVSVSQSTVADGSASLQRQDWGFDDWDFADRDEILSSGSGVVSGEPMARVVFGGVPSLQEAKDATSELKVALDKVYLSSTDSKDCDDAIVVDHVSGQLLLTDSESIEGKYSIASEPKAPTMPKYAIQAFSLLRESPAAQSVVASIASDPNVWNAVMRNDALMDYLESCKKNAVHQDATYQDDTESLKCDESSDETLSDDAGFKLMNFLENIKLSMAEMVSNVSSFVQNMFGPTTSNVNEEDGKAKSTFNMDTTLGASFMALATMVITVVVLRRV